jgi:hypothetical protein
MLSQNISDLQLRFGHRSRILFQSSSQRAILQILETLERADRIADRLGGDVSVARCRAKLGVAKQDLNDPNISIGFQ